MLAGVAGGLVAGMALPPTAFLVCLSVLHALLVPALTVAVIHSSRSRRAFFGGALVVAAASLSLGSVPALRGQLGEWPALLASFEVPPAEVLASGNRLERFWALRPLLALLIGGLAGIAVRRLPGVYRQLRTRQQRRDPLKTYFTPAATPCQPREVDSYFGHDRAELAELVPREARRILEVGCGAGRLGELLKSRQPAEVTGIELNPDAARRAQARLDRVLTCDIEECEAEFAPGAFDCIICADVLEHLRDPQATLRQLRRWLSPDGHLVVSLPNVQHFTVVNSLLNGNWTYEPAGLLDRTHLQFFTRREIEKLFYRAGFAIGQRSATYVGQQSWEAAGRPGVVRINGLKIQGLSRQQAEDYFTYQFLLRAAPVERPSYGVTSIVILTHNQLSYTQRCVDSIRQFTDEPIELIFVDNASTDGTREYLASLSDIKVILNDENRGFPAGCNQGIAVATGSQVLLLNNDVIVTTGWLERLLHALYQADDVGLVGPLTNEINGQQKIPVTYRELSELDGFAWERSQQHARQTSEVSRLMGFCLLIRGEVLQQVGVLDERFGIGNYEDDDYCRRTLAAGYRLLIAQDAFIHHFGSRTFSASDLDYRALLARNKQLFREKWAA